MTYAIIVIIVLSIILLLTYLFPLAEVYGNSMFPTLKEGDKILCSRLFKTKEGDIYIINSPNFDKLAIKRLHTYIDYPCPPICYFLGDNPPESYDSRDYGFIKAEDIVAKLIWQIPKQLKSKGD